MITLLTCSCENVRWMEAVQTGLRCAGGKSRVWSNLVPTSDTINVGDTVFVTKGQNVLKN